MVGKETLGFRDKVIDSEFKNSEIEWSTKQYGATILYGLLVKADPPQWYTYTVLICDNVHYVCSWNEYTDYLFVVKHTCTAYGGIVKGYNVCTLIEDGYNYELIAKIQLIALL